MVLHVRVTKNPSEWCDCCDVMTAECWLATGRTIYDVTLYDVKRSRDLGDYQSEREKVNRGIGEWGHVTSLAYDTSSLRSRDPFSTNQSAIFCNCSPVPRKWPRNRKSRMNPFPSPPEVTPHTPGSDRATGSYEITPLNCSIAQWNNWPLYLCWMLYAYACGTPLGWFPTTHARGVTSARSIVL